MLYYVPMYIDIVPNRNSRPAFLLRESWREKNKIKKRTLANLSSLSEEQIRAIQKILKQEMLFSTDQLFEIQSTQLHGHVEAVLIAMKQLKWSRLFPSTLSSQDQ